MRPRETTFSRSKNVISLLLHWLQGGNKHNKKMLPSVPSADPASGSRSRRFHRPTLISLRYPTFLLFPVLRRFLRLVSTSFNLLPLSNLKVNFRELPSGARITGLLLSVNPLVSIPSFSRGYPYLSGQHPRLRSAPICGTECFR